MAVVVTEVAAGVGARVVGRDRAGVGGVIVAAVVKAATAAAAAVAAVTPAANQGTWAPRVRGTEAERCAPRGREGRHEAEGKRSGTGGDGGGWRGTGRWAKACTPLLPQPTRTREHTMWSSRFRRSCCGRDSMAAVCREGGGEGGRRGGRRMGRPHHPSPLHSQTNCACRRRRPDSPSAGRWPPAGNAVPAGTGARVWAAALAPPPSPAGTSMFSRGSNSAVPWSTSGGSGTSTTSFTRFRLPRRLSPPPPLPPPPPPPPLLLAPPSPPLSPISPLLLLVEAALSPPRRGLTCKNGEEGTETAVGGGGCGGGGGSAGDANPDEALRAASPSRKSRAEEPPSAPGE